MVEISSAEAILFFDSHEIIKQMNFAEFQAILDNYVPMQEIANQSMEAVYVRIDSNLTVTATVFFRIAFDHQGFVERSWNIPLQQLADSANRGPNLGAGAIKLACFSQCPVDWRKNQLWDPTMKATLNDFNSIRKAIKNNSLGLMFRKKDEEEAVETLPSSFDEERTKAAMIIKEQRLKQKLLSNKADQDMRQLSLDHQERVLKYQQKINDLEKQLNEQRSLTLEYQETIVGQNDKIEGMREYFESKLQQVQNSESDQLETLKDHYESEVLLQVETAVSEFKAQLNARDVELMYRSEKEDKLQQEILNLQKENHQLKGRTGGAVIEQLTDAGIDFVIYHPGAGHLTIPSSEISAYIENPTAYVAQQCGVNEHLYRTWLDHFYSPQCQHELSDGDICDKPLARTDDPSQFIIGESDRCSGHQKNTPSVISISKNGRQAR